MTRQLGREEMYASSAMSIGMGSVHLQLQVLTRGMDAGSGIHIGGRGFHSSTSQLNLSRFCH